MLSIQNYIELLLVIELPYDSANTEKENAVLVVMLFKSREVRTSYHLCSFGNHVGITLHDDR